MPITPDWAAATGLPPVIQEDAFAILPFRRPADTAANAEEPRRPARTIAFPPPAAGRCRLMAQLAQAVADRLDSGHIEIFEAAADLLALDDHGFAERLRFLQTDGPGRQLLADLLATVRSAAVDFDRGSRILFTMSARLTAGLAHTKGSNL